MSGMSWNCFSLVYVSARYDTACKGITHRVCFHEIFTAYITQNNNMHVCTHEQYGSKCPCPRNDSAKTLCEGSWKKHVNDDKPRDLCMKKDAAVNVTTPLSSCFCPTWWLSPTTSPWVAPLNSKSIRHLWTPLRWKRKICHLLSSWYATQEDSNLKCPAIGPPWIHWNGQHDVCCL